MSASDGLRRLGQVIDWICAALALILAVAVIWALLFNGARSDARFLLIGPILLFLFGKAARYIINGFAN